MADTSFWLVCDDVPHDVVLTDPGVRVMEVVQVVRRLTGLSLWRSKVLATQVPAVLLTGVPEEDAAAAVSACAMRELGRRREMGRRRTSRNTEHGPVNGLTAQRQRKAPSRKEGGLLACAYFFLPWFFTASIAAAAASGSRYLPPGVTGLKSASSS